MLVRIATLGLRILELVVGLVGVALEKTAHMALVIRFGGRVHTALGVYGGIDGSALIVDRIAVAGHPLPPWIERLPRFREVVSGSMALVGPQPIPAEDLRGMVLERARRAVRPGVVSLHELRLRAQIAFDPEWMTELEYAVSRTPAGDFGILGRWIVSSVLPKAGVGTDTASVCGVPIDNTTTQRTLEHINAVLASRGRCRIAFVNADCVNKARTDTAYLDALESADLRLPDGIGVRLGAALLGTPIQENVNGTDLFPRLCAQLETSQHSLFLLGAEYGVAEQVAEWIREHFPRLRIAGYHHGYFSAESADSIANVVRRSRASVVLTAFGAPRQEIFNARYHDAMGAHVVLGVGGLFDFYGGRIPRAPGWMRELGMEWAFRLVQEPRRLCRRYVIGNAVFLANVCRARMRAWWAK